MPRSATLALVAAVAGLAVLAWFLLQGPDVPPPVVDTPDAPPSRTAPRPDAPPLVDGTADRSNGPAAGTGPEAAAPDTPATAPAEPAYLPVAELTAVREDGRPLAGVLVGALHAAWDEAFADRVPRGPWRTGSDGTVRVPGIVGEVSVHHLHARPVRADGAVLHPPAAGVRWGRLATTGGPATVVFRDDPGTAFVRLLDNATGEPVTVVDGLVVTYEFGERHAQRAIYRHGRDPGQGGWIPLPEAAVPDDLTLDLDPADVRVAITVPGWATAHLPLLEVRGRREVRVDPVEADVIGVIVVPVDPLVSGIDRAAGDARVDAMLRPLEQRRDRAETRVKGLPLRPGAFALYDVADGEWELEVAVAGAGGRITRAKRAFTKAGGPVDLGGILVTPGAGIMVRVVDRDGEVVPQALAVVVREDEEVAEGRRLDWSPGSDGWASVADLEPGASHIAAATGLPRPLEQRVLAPDQGEVAEVELQWPERLVACRIRLRLDGAVLANPDGVGHVPATIVESPIPRGRGSWTPDGVLVTELVPGTYRFAAWATPPGTTDLVLHAGEVTVPPTEDFEATVDLAPEPGARR